MTLAESTNRRQRHARADLDDHETLGQRLPPAHTLHLALRAIFQPRMVPKHQDVGTCETAAMSAAWNVSDHSAGTLVDDRIESGRRPDLPAAWFRALQIMNRSMAFQDVAFCKTRLLELAVDVARINECPVPHARCPTPKHRKSGVRVDFAIALQAMAIEAPGELGVRAECVWVCDGLKAALERSQCWIGAPQTFVATKIRKTGVNAHACACGNEKRVGIANPFGGACNRFRRCPREIFLLHVCSPFDFAGGAVTPATWGMCGAVC